MNVAVNVLAAGLTDRGRVRKSNEDALLIDPDACLYAVADGMGGHNAGEVASRLAIDTLVEFVRTSASDSSITWPYGFNTTLAFEANQLKSAVQLANQQIRHHATQTPSFDGMGSTIIAVMARHDDVCFAGVGDSRLYRWRSGTLEQLSEDDSWAASMLRAGADPEYVRSHAMRHMLTRALGSDQALEVEVRHVETAPGDLLLLCSDGLYGPLEHGGIAAVLATSHATLEEAAAGLIRAANDAGGPDNVTVILVRVGATAGDRPQGLLAGQQGQALSEYLVTAGVLVAVGIAAAGTLMKMFQMLVSRIAYEVQFLSP